MTSDVPPTEPRTRLAKPPTISNRDLFRWGSRAWLVGAAAFLVVAVFAAIYDRFPGDEAITGAFQKADVPVLGGYLAFINVIGSPWVYIPMTIVIAVAFGVVRAGWESLLVLYTAGARVLNSLLKDIVDRPRPSEDLVDVTETVHSFSFPSGHTVGTTALFAVLFFVIPVVVEWRPLRWLLQSACVVAIVSAGPARVYVGVHWPSDVIAGYALAILVVAPALVAYLRLR